VRIRLLYQWNWLPQSRAGPSGEEKHPYPPPRESNPGHPTHSGRANVFIEISYGFRISVSENNNVTDKHFYYEINDIQIHD
jgi:hypothetical protein